MTADTENATARKLFEAFSRFRALHRKQGSIGGLTPGEMMMLWCVNRTEPNEDSKYQR